MKTRLVHSRLAGCDASSEYGARFARVLRPEFDFGELRHVPAAMRDAIVDVGFDLSLHDADTDEIVVQVSALFQLTFECDEDVDRHALVCVRAPREAWALFRAHVDRVLGEMGLAPYTGNRFISTSMLGLADDVLRETREIDNRVAAPRR